MTGSTSEPGIVATVAGLTVTGTDGRAVVTDGHLTLRAGRITLLTGRSGSGKTTLMRALLGHLPDGLTRQAGTVDVLGTDPFALGPRELQTFRRGHLAFVGQDPGAALNPIMRVRDLLTEMSGPGSPPPAQLLEQVLLSPDHLTRRPRQLSGGEQRRVAVARALARQVRVLLIDEPLAGLDARLRSGITTLLRDLADRHGFAVLVSGHDEATLRPVADEVVELSTPTTAPVAASASTATPVGGPDGGSGRPGVVLAAHGLLASLPGGRVLVRDVDLTIRAGEATALVGPSGAGKSTVARAVVGLHPEGGGRLELHGTRLHRRAARRSRDQSRRIAWIPQDPRSTLNPSQTVRATLTRPLLRHRLADRAHAGQRCTELLAQVGLPADFADRYPHELSGGQRQRVAIARALACEPDLLVCDEITSALDDTTARAVLDLLTELRVRRGTAVLLITHQLSQARSSCSTVTVLHEGTIVESGPVAAVLGAPTRPAAVDLLGAGVDPGTIHRTS